MQYRKFGKSDLEVSILGFGCMRFPLDKNAPLVNGEPDSAAIDEAEAIKMLRYGIDNGINYIDTAYPYHKEQSEILVGKALKDGYREKVRLVTKLPRWLVKETEDFDKFLNEQLQKLDTSSIDVYVVHALNQPTWEKLLEQGVIDFLNKAKADGRIKYTGFSFHGEIDYFTTIVDGYDWDMCQVQFNYMEDPKWEDHIKYVASKGMSVVVMEPLLGGKLANNVPADIQEVWDTAPQKRTPAEWALRWIWNHPEVTLLLSGMSTMPQVEENVRIAGDALPNAMAEDEVQMVEKVRDLYKQKIKVNCTQCEYCMPCPQNVVIPGVFHMYNTGHMFDMYKEMAFPYGKMMEGKKDASQCVECGECEGKCPQNLKIVELLKEAHGTLSK